MGKKTWADNSKKIVNMAKANEKSFEEKTHEELSQEAKRNYAKLSASEKAVKQTSFKGYSEEDISKLNDLVAEKQSFVAVSVKTTGFNSGNKPMLVNIAKYDFDEEKNEYAKNTDIETYICDKDYEFEETARFNSFDNNGIDRSVYSSRQKSWDEAKIRLDQIFDNCRKHNAPILSFATEKSVNEPLKMIGVSLDGYEKVLDENGKETDEYVKYDRNIDVRNVMVYENARAVEVMDSPIFANAKLSECLKYYTDEKLPKFTTASQYCDALVKCAIVSQNVAVKDTTFSETFIENYPIMYGSKEDERTEEEKKVDNLEKDMTSMNSALADEVGNLANSMSEFQKSNEKALLKLNENTVSADDFKKYAESVDNRFEEMQNSLDKMVSLLTTVTKAIPVTRTIDKTEKDKADKNKAFDKKDLTGHEEEIVNDEYDV